jgi:hypothetical protein
MFGLELGPEPTPAADFAPLSSFFMVWPREDAFKASRQHEGAWFFEMEGWKKSQVLED